MPQLGPELPPHLREKRKHSDDEDESDPPPRPTSAVSGENVDKRPKTIGPTLPPHLQPGGTDGGSESDSSNDDFGPSLPSVASSAQPERPEVVEQPPHPPPSMAKPVQRDSWMLVPPSESDWSSRVDPTKLRNRKFNTGKGAKGPSQGPKGVSDVWSETPEQKRKRLENEVMGIQSPASTGDYPHGSMKSEADKERARRKIQEHTEKSRGKTLYEQHQKTTKEKDDDPSARPFDREKDIRGGVKINRAKRKEMLNHASNFGSKFSGGNYL